MPNPGGIPWSGAAADAAHLRAHSDRAKVITLADQLHGAAATARSGAFELQAAKQRVLSAVSAARAEGFAVGEDLAVAYPHRVSSPAEAAARQAQATALSVEIRRRAAALTALDQQVAARITALAGDVDKVNFKESPPDADALSVKNADDVHTIVDPLPPGKHPGVKTLPTPEAIRGLFEHLTENSVPAPPTTYPGERRVLEDGTIIGYRPKSGWGGPTVEIEYPDGTEVDVHLPERPKPPEPAPVPAPAPAPVPAPAPAPLPAPDPSPIGVPDAPGVPGDFGPTQPLTAEEGGVLAVIAGAGAAVIVGTWEFGKWVFSP